MNMHEESMKAEKLIRDQLNAAAKLTNSKVTELPLSECNDVRARVLRKFISERDMPPAGFSTRRRQDTWPLWESLQDMVSVQNAEAWRWVSDFVGHTSTIMFFNEDETQSMFRFVDGSQVVAVLGECYPFEFYLTNDATAYLLCFNHHDFLIAAGTAALWLEQQLRNQPPAAIAGT